MTLNFSVFILSSRTAILFKPASSILLSFDFLPSLDIFFSTLPSFWHLQLLPLNSTLNFLLCRSQLWLLMISYPPHVSAVDIFLWSSLWLYSDMGPCRVCRKTYNSKIVARNDDSSNFHENMGSQSTIFLFKPWCTRCGYLFWPFLTQFSTSCNSELQVFHSQVLATDCRIFLLLAVIFQVNLLGEKASSLPLWSTVE